MKTTLRISICALALLIGGLGIFYFGQRSFHATTFCGPEFHARDVDDIKDVYSELSDHLAAMGFHLSTSPSAMDSWAGVHSAGAKRVWFARKESRDQTTFVYADLDGTAVRTSLKWEVYGTNRKKQSAERLAYSVALDLDGWFEKFSASNALPQRLREEKRRDYQNHLVEK